MKIIIKFVCTLSLLFIYGCSMITPEPEVVITTEPMLTMPDEEGTTDRVESEDSLDVRQMSNDEYALDEYLIYFDYNKYDLKEDSEKVINSYINYMKKNGSSNIIIEGHADERGSRAYNLALGEKRADAVKEIFLLNNISDTRIETVSYGEEKPVVDAYSEESHSLNRRVELKFKK